MNKTITQFKWLVTMLLLVTAMVMPKMAWAEPYDNNGFAEDGSYQPATLTTDQYDINGDGTKDEVYEIGNAGQLYWFAALVNVELEGETPNASANAVLTANITVNKDLLASVNEDGTVKDGKTVVSWTPIGGNVEYTGIFDGQGHTISGLYFKDPDADHVGLFGKNSGTIRNVGVVDSYFCGSDNVGGVCGYNNYGTITGCYNTGSVSGSSSYTGGVCGFNGGTITGCYNTGTVSGSNSNTGGVCGFNGGTITGCYTNNDVVCGNDNGTLDDCGENTNFTDGTVCSLLNTALKKVNASVRFYQGTYNPELISYIEGVYQISNKEELYAFALFVNNGETNANAKLTADITVNTGVLDSYGNLNHNGSGFEPWTPIGNGQNPFTGTFDGQGHTISGLYLDNSELNNVGLFGRNSGTIKNVGVIDSYFYGNNYVGGVCGRNGGGAITGCYNTGTVSGNECVGGVCGENREESTITGCYNTGTVSGRGSNTGGVCGFNSGTITGCYNTGTVSGSSKVGGVCGDNYFATITGCYNTGAVSGEISYVGGVCGKNNGGTITGCYTNNGGVCGENGGTITGCYYLANEEDGNGGKTEEQFKSGEVAYLMNNVITDGTQKWHQNIDREGATKDPYPVLDNTHGVVYQCSVCTSAYSNTEGAKGAHDYVDDGNGFLTCEACGTKSYQPATLNASNQYEISNAGQLYWFAALVNGDESVCDYDADTNSTGTKQNSAARAKLTADIVVNSGPAEGETMLESLEYDTASGNVTNGSSFVAWTPMGNYQNPFTGTFDGQGHTISGLYLDNSVLDNVGLFGSNSGTIKNVGVVDSYFYGNNYVGGVCGGNSSTITGCYNTGAVRGNDWVGGVCGSNEGTITGCYNTGQVHGNDLVGGVCGSNSGTITGCYNTGTVSGKNWVGGVCGSNGGTITSCYYLANEEDGNGGKTEGQFKSDEVCSLLNDALKIENASVRFYQEGANYPEFIKNLPSLVGDVYQISNKEELYAFALLVNNGETSANAVLTKDITVNNDVLDSEGNPNDNNNGSCFEPWTPIGNAQNPYTGTFDGQGHTISGLYFNDSNVNFVGLFGSNSGTIKNVGVVDSYFCGNDWVGGVCGGNDDTITGCYNIGSVGGNNKVGGVCGENRATITGCYNTGTVRGWKNYTGGVCGYNSSTITGCYNNTGEVSGDYYVGGVCGENGCTITGCYNTGAVRGYKNYVGGVCGYNNNDGTITGCYNTGAVLGNNDVGGVCGRNDYGTITGCYTNSGSVCGNDNGTLDDCGVKSDYDFTNGTVCTLLNKALKKANASVRFYQGANYPELFMNVPSLAEGVYQISNKEELYAFALLVNKGEKTANAVLTADIVVNTGVLKSNGTLADNVSGFEPWTPIGIPYEGTFDGQGHTISGLYLDNRKLNNVGLFGRNSGTIKNVGVIDSYFCGNNQVGGVCGNNVNGGTISDCYNMGSVGGNDWVGGVCGNNVNGGTIIGCYNTGSVSGNSNIGGGVCGENGGTITGCYNTGTVSGNDYVGGVCGYNNNGGTITGCYNTGAVSGNYLSGGVCGLNEGTITNCYYLASNDDGNGGKTTEQFSSGEVCYLLSQGSTVTDGENTTYYSGASWGQRLGTDDYPVLSDYKVIKAAEGANKTYWATFSNQSSDMDLSDLTVYTAKVSEGILTLTPCTNNIVAKGEGVLVKGNSEYLNALMRNDKTETPEANNDLVATPAEPTVINATTGHVLYRLTYNKVSTKEGLGFYLSLVKGENNNVIENSVGSQLKATPGKAYLNVSTAAATPSSSNVPALGFAFPCDGETTGISEMVIKGNAGISGAANADGRIYNLQGLQVSAPAKGLYIKNNKKVIVK